VIGLGFKGLIKPVKTFGKLSTPNLKPNTKHLKIKI